MADSTTDYNNLDPLGDEAAVVDEVDAAVSGARKKPRAVDMVPEEPDAMAPDEEYQLTPAGRRERIGQIVRLVKKYRVWDNLTPVRLRRLLEELGPMFVKMGQILANRDSAATLLRRAASSALRRGARTVRGRTQLSGRRIRPAPGGDVRCDRPQSAW